MALVCAALSTAAMAAATPIEVTTNADELDAGACTAGDSDCSLREAIVAANAAAGADTIRIPAGTYATASDPDGAATDPATGDYDITDDVTIERAPSGGTVTIDGNEMDRVFSIAKDKTVAISDIRITNGRGELGIDEGKDGGGIRNYGDLTLTRVAMDHNHARRSGGAVYTFEGGDLHVVDSSFTENDAVQEGGAIWVRDVCIQSSTTTYVPATVTIDRAVIRGNSAASEGGGLFLAGTSSTVRMTEISDNSSKFGGGAWINSGCFNHDALLSNVTVSGNKSTETSNVGGGGGIYVAGDLALRLEDSTIANNASALRAANLEHFTQSSDQVTPTVIKRTLFALGRRLVGGNPSGSAPDCDIFQGQPIQSDHSLADDATCRLTPANGDKPSTPAGLGALGNNGGPSRTHAIGAGSAAIDAGGIGCPATDQRGAGFPRPIGSACDIGAFEGESSGAPDGDGDGFPDASDNCPAVANASQANADGDAQGDACEDDDDNDGVADGADNCPLNANAGQENTDLAADGGDACDSDDDNDSAPDVSDNCVSVANPQQEDNDHNGIGNACEPSVRGIVQLDNDPVADALVSLCAGTAGCRTVETDPDGLYRFDGIPVGIVRIGASYGVNVLPSSEDVEIKPGGTFHEIDLNSSDSPPDGTRVGGKTFKNGEIATSHWDQPFELEQEACRGAKVDYQLILGAKVVRRGRMESTEEDDTLYRATIRPLKPNHGYATVKITVNGCAAFAGPRRFDFYIDPSGKVLDVKGRPIFGATLRLLRSDAQAGPFTKVPDGSLIMSPTNRRNEDKSDASGHFGWDVIPGYYKVEASKTGCHVPGQAGQKVAHTAVLTIPPPVVDLDIRLDCPYKPKLALGPLPGGNFSVSKSGKTSYRVRNLSPFKIGGAVAFRRGKAKLAARRFKLGANLSSDVTVKLSRAARKLLAKRKRIKVTAVVSASGPAGSKASAKRAITLRR